MPALSGVSKRFILHCCWLVSKGEFGYGFHYHFTSTHTLSQPISIRMLLFIKNVLLCYSHLFAIANFSYTTMMDAKKDQCIVIRYKKPWISCSFQLAALGQNSELSFKQWKAILKKRKTWVKANHKCSCNFYYPVQNVQLLGNKDK